MKFAMFQNLVILLLRKKLKEIKRIVKTGLRLRDNGTSQFVADSASNYFMIKFLFSCVYRLSQLLSGSLRF